MPELILTMENPAAKVVVSAMGVFILLREMIGLFFLLQKLKTYGLFLQYYCKEKKEEKGN